MDCHGMAWLVLAFLVLSWLVSALFLPCLCLVCLCPVLSCFCSVSFLVYASLLFSSFSSSFHSDHALKDALSCIELDPNRAKGYSRKVLSCLVLSFWCYLCLSLLVLYLCCLFSAHLVFWSGLCRCQVVLSFGLCVVSLSLFWSLFLSLSYFIVFVRVQPF
jgi:hypothetical protein